MNLSATFLGGFGNWVSGWIGERATHYSGIALPVPEPETWLMLSVGIALVIVFSRK